MKVALLRVGIDSGLGGMSGPLFSDGSFEYIPIPDSDKLDERTYGNQLGRTGRPLIDFFPLSRREKMGGQSMHFDPEFDTFTYGDPTRPKGGLRRLDEGDILVFYAGLAGLDHEARPELYIIGYFEVIFAGIANDLSEKQLRACKANFHVRHIPVFDRQRDHLVLVKGGPGSRMLERAVKLSAMGKDRTGKPLKILSPEMQQIFGSFGGKLSFQRSPTRWVAEGYVERAANFVRGLP
jgi:hypothetical protein